MYLVELISGKETIYRSLDEFTDAIRRGEVTAQSRIYHRAASTWIPVTFHPQFRKVSAEQSASFAEPLPPRDWTFLRTDLAPSAREVAPSEEVVPPGEAARQEAAATPGRQAAVSPSPVKARNWRTMLSELVRHH